MYIFSYWHKQWPKINWMKHSCSYRLLQILHSYSIAVYLHYALQLFQHLDYATTIFRVNIWVPQWGADVWAQCLPVERSNVFEKKVWRKYDSVCIHPHGWSLWDAWLFQRFPWWFEDEKCQCLPGLLLCIVECNSIFGPQEVFSDCSQPHFLYWYLPFPTWSILLPWRWKQQAPH